MIILYLSADVDGSIVAVSPFPIRRVSLNFSVEIAQSAPGDPGRKEAPNWEEVMPNAGEGMKSGDMPGKPPVPSLGTSPSAAIIALAAGLRGAQDFSVGGD
jgi:hypothetical protein